MSHKKQGVTFAELVAVAGNSLLSSRAILFPAFQARTLSQTGLSTTVLESLSDQRDSALPQSVRATIIATLGSDGSSMALSSVHNVDTSYLS